jgi:hypothetical protein
MSEEKEEIEEKEEEEEEEENLKILKEYVKDTPYKKKSNYYININGGKIDLFFKKTKS